MWACISRYWSTRRRMHKTWICVYLVWFLFEMINAIGLQVYTFDCHTTTWHIDFAFWHIPLQFHCFSFLCYRVLLYIVHCAWCMLSYVYICRPRWVFDRKTVPSHFIVWQSCSVLKYHCRVGTRYGNTLTVYKSNFKMFVKKDASRKTPLHGDFIIRWHQRQFS